MVLSQRPIEHTDVLLVDAAALVVRYSYGSMAVMGTDDPVHRAAGAVQTVRRIANLIATLRPSHPLVARDCSHEDNLRRIMVYDGYKQGRPEHHPSVLHNAELTFQVAGLVGWYVKGADGLEADDVIASACKSFPDDAITIVTSDHDLLALCSDNVTVRLLGNRGAYQDCGPEQCLEHFGVPPWLVRHYKALAGDPSDNYPGVRGVGKKLALDVLKAYKSVIEVYRRIEADEDLSKLSPRLVQLLKDGHEQAIDAWNLAGLKRNVELDKDLLDIRGICSLSDVREPLCDLGLGQLFADTSASSFAGTSGRR